MDKTRMLLLRVKFRENWRGTGTALERERMSSMIAAAR